jgi:hypothetical protein
MFNDPDLATLLGDIEARISRVSKIDRPVQAGCDSLEANRFRGQRSDLRSIFLLPAAGQG